MDFSSLTKQELVSLLTELNDGEFRKDWSKKRLLDRLEEHELIEIIQKLDISALKKLAKGNKFPYEGKTRDQLLDSFIESQKVWNNKRLLDRLEGDEFIETIQKLDISILKKIAKLNKLPYEDKTRNQLLDSFMWWKQGNKPRRFPRAIKSMPRKSMTSSNQVLSEKPDPLSKVFQNLRSLVFSKKHTDRVQGLTLLEAKSPTILLFQQNIQRMTGKDILCQGVHGIFPDDSYLQCWALGMLARWTDVYLKHYAFDFDVKKLGIPSTFWSIRDLDTLSLSNLELSVLPEEIGQLSGLKKLDVSNNQLSVLPAYVGELTTLQTLVLNSNCFSTIPACLSGDTLKNLHIKYNPLSSLPADISNWKLDSLSFSIDSMTDVTPTAALTQIEHLDIHSSMDAADVPESMQHLTHLESLTIFDASTLPDDIGLLTNLKELHLEECCLSEVPLSFAQLTSLERLRITFDDSVTTLPWSVNPDIIEELHASGITEGDFPNIKRASVGGNLRSLGQFQFGSDIESLQVTVYDDLEDWDFNLIAHQYSDEDGYYEYDEVVEGVLKDLFGDIPDLDYSC